jgi:hypothetical protein
LESKHLKFLAPLFLLLFVGLLPMANAQTQVWASATVKAALSKRWDAAVSIEQRWRGTEFNQFADLRINRDAKNKWNYFYEFRAPFSQSTKARHTLALEKTFKPKISGLKIADVNAGIRYHFNRNASVRYGLYAQRNLGIWTPELSSEWWYEQFSPFSSLRRTRLTAGLSIKQGKHLKWSAMVALQRDYRGLDILEADFAIVRLGLRYKV